MIDMLVVDGEVEVEVAAQRFLVVCRQDVIEVHFPHLTALQTVGKIVRARQQALLGGWWTKLQPHLALIDLQILVDGRMVARLGSQASPNALGRKLGWEGAEVFPLKSFLAWWRSPR